MKFTGWEEKVRFCVPPFFMCAGAAVIAVRLVFLHLDLVEKKPTSPKYDFTRNVQGHRGAIISAEGTTLAKTTSLWEYRVDPQVAVGDPKHTGRPVDSAERMRKIREVSGLLGLPLAKVMDAYAVRNSRFVPLALSDDTAVHAELTNPKRGFRELSISEKQTRLYPQGRRLSHVLGFVSKDPANSVGGAGVELKYENYLKGTPGMVHGTRDAAGREERSRRDLDIDAKPGCDVHLTINNIVQYETEKALRGGLAEHRAERAWAIVLSVKTGAVLAMASLPDYEPERFNKYSADVKINRAISEVYEPGSVMKTITACAVINEGRVGPDTMVNTARNDSNYYRLPGDSGHRWEERMSVRDALVHSSNIVFGKLGYDLGPKRLYDYMTKFGLGRKTGIQLPGEEIGLVPKPASWDKVKWSRAPIGQGVAVTAIQLAAAYAAIGNDGVLLRPYIVEKVEQADDTVVYSHKKEVVGRVVRPEVARAVCAMMTGVAKKGGTARRAAVPGYSVAGKTGTAQMKEGRGYSSTNFNASFIGIVPATRPELVVLVTFQKPYYCRSRSTSEAAGVPMFNHQGGVCAAPTFRRIAEVVLRYLEIEPDIPEEIPEEDDV
jgi:cell division protein FtsI (penicillin-binding protein 3)